MAEQFPPESNSNEELPFVRLDFGDREVLATPDNTSLFTFIGRLASRNHIFVQTDMQDGRATGTYIFGATEGFGELAKFMWEHNFPMHLNAREVAECDENAYQTYIDQVAAKEGGEIPDTLPDDFN